MDVTCAPFQLAYNAVGNAMLADDANAGYSPDCNDGVPPMDEGGGGVDLSNESTEGGVSAGITSAEMELVSSQATIPKREAQNSENMNFLANM